MSMGITKMELSKIGTPGSKELAAGQADQIRDRLTSALRLVDDIAGKPVPEPARTVLSITEPQVRALIKLRRNRARYFDADLFFDPAWDMILELYAAELGQRRISITSLAGGAAVPYTTAQRWMGTLEAKGLIQRQQDPFDGRRYFMSLSPRGFEAIEGFFRSVPFGATLI